MFNKVVDKVIVGLGLIGLLFLWGMCINAFACTGDECKKESNVGDINDGKTGDIFTYYCEKGAVVK